MKSNNIILICFLLISISCHSQQKQDIELRNIFDKVLNDLSESSFDVSMIEGFQYKEILFLKPEQVRQVYQNDTLIDQFDFNNDYCYLFGKNVKSLKALIVLRSYGEWMKTLELLTYDSKYALEGYLVLCGYGGGMNYQNEYFGYFQNDSMYIRIKVFTEEIGDPFANDDIRTIKTDTTYSKYLVTRKGSISLQ